ncbi:MAG: hypothetical protein AAB971_03450, partial [Patescibacteria group bacterium]
RRYSDIISRMNVNPQNPFRSAVEPPIQNPLSVMQPGEELIFEVKRHPIGMLGMYLMAGFLLLALSVLAFGVAPSLFGDSSSAQAMSIGLAVVFVAAILIAIFLFISNKVYWGNSWILTSDSLIQVIQVSLFDKNSSQLSLKHLEDVGAEQNGILAHLFNYGVITAESAGATDTFIFNFCPNPNYYARLIVATREQLEQKYRHETEAQDSEQTQSDHQFPA